MGKINELKENRDIVLYYETEFIKDHEYLFTFRKIKDGKFISDQSILELWEEKLEEISWVNPDADFKYALKVYDRQDGYFTSIAPVILCDGKDVVTKEFIEKLFNDLKDPIDRQVIKPNKYAQEFNEILRENGFTRQLVGGGCYIRI